MVFDLAPSYRGLNNYLKGSFLKGSLRIAIRAIIRVEYRGLNNDQYYFGCSFL